MDKVITYKSLDSDVVSEGRNGLMIAGGVVARITPTRVAILPLTSKHKVGRGSIGLPKDPEILRAFAANLEALAFNLEEDARIESDPRIAS